MTVHFFSPRQLPKKNRLLTFARKICQRIGKLRSRGEICTAFISDRQIQKLNKFFFKRNCATDVIAFPYNFKKPYMVNRRREAVPFGDIFISLDTAKRQAQSGKHPLYQELALLIAHGLLHLTGYQDTDPVKKKKMFQMQKRLFRTLDPKLAPPDILR